MGDPAKVLARVIEELECGLRTLQGFGVRYLQRAGPSAEKPEETEEQPEQTGGEYRFGDGRRARWEQAARVEPLAEKRPAGADRRQVHMFGSGEEYHDPEEDRQAEPNPLSREEAQVLMDELREEIGDCTRCRLAEGRNKLVFGAGDPVARLVFAGEGPGRDEDASGEPFVGRAGKLLDRILAAMQFSRQEIYICNVVKCRPPNNRTPQEDEMRMCGQFLTRQLEIMRPQIIVALGATAARYLTGTNQSMGKMRGRFFAHPCGAKVMPTYHPAYLLRNPSAKKAVWEDLQQVMLRMGKQVPGS